MAHPPGRRGLSYFGISVCPTSSVVSKAMKKGASGSMAESARSDVKG